MILIHFLTFLQAEALDVFVVKTKKKSLKICLLGSAVQVWIWHIGKYFHINSHLEV